MNYFGLQILAFFGILSFTALEKQKVHFPHLVLTFNQLLYSNLEWTVNINQPLTLGYFYKYKYHAGLQ